jgi:hypothetical protein
MNLQRYSEARNKVEKISIVSSTLMRIKELASPEGAFVKVEDGFWYQVDESFAREKIGGLFRDGLHTKYRSSTKSKLARKKAPKELGGLDGDSNHTQHSSYTASLTEATFSPTKTVSPTKRNEEIPFFPSNDAFFCMRAPTTLYLSYEPSSLQQHGFNLVDDLINCLTQVEYGTMHEKDNVVPAACDLIVDFEESEDISDIEEDFSTIFF